MTKPTKAPNFWSSFVHLGPFGYMDYAAGIVKASTRKVGRAIDIDVRVDADGVLWGLHSKTIGENGLVDPLGKIPANAKIEKLRTAEILRLRSENGKRAHRMSYYLQLAADLNVRVEAELKMLIPALSIKRLLRITKIRTMAARGLLQWKTLVGLSGYAARMQAAHEGSKGTKAVTMLCFTEFDKPVSKTIWSHVDYYRGEARWV